MKYKIHALIMAISLVMLMAFFHQYGLLIWIIGLLVYIKVKRKDVNKNGR